MCEAFVRKLDASGNEIPAPAQESVDAQILQVLVEVRAAIEAQKDARGDSAMIGRVIQRLDSLERTRDKVAEQYNAVEAWMTRVERLSLQIGAMTDTAHATAGLVNELLARVDALEQAVQSCIKHQGETAQLLQELAGQIDKSIVPAAGSFEAANLDSPTAG